jgi:hypothetical protein
MTIVTRDALYKTLLPTLEKMFDDQYANYRDGTEYHVRSRYGKYSIYKWEYNGGIRKNSTTLAKGLDKETATGMMKLLKEPK